MSEIEAVDDAQVLDLEVKPVDPFPAEDVRPCWGCYGGWTVRQERKYRPGVYYHGMTKETGGNSSIPFDTWICGPLHIEALTANQEDSDHGRLLHYQSGTGQWKRWAVLLGEGLEIDLKQKSRLLEYINSQPTAKRLRAATTTGWHGAAFVLPDEVIGADDIWFQASERTAPYGTAGTLEGWRTEVAARAVGNPLLTLGISAALAGVLLERLNIDGAGLHLFGDSSTGKTSVLMAAISVWGGPAFRRTWRTTANGLEGAAKMHTGTMLALDEVGECGSRDLYESAYALVNGHGKTRANVRGEARQVSRWRVFVLSTGEVTIAARMEAGGFEAKAGQALRLLDVPVSGRYGAWDDLQGMVSGAALSDAIRDGAARHYGHAGRAFVLALIEALAEDGDLSGRLAVLVGKFKATGGQETRAARIFALCALAGELATQAGVVPWKPGHAARAALYCFDLWRDHRGADGRNAEDAAILRAVADFIDRHGDSRFDVHLRVSEERARDTAARRQIVSSVCRLRPEIKIGRRVGSELIVLRGHDCGQCGHFRSLQLTPRKFKLLVQSRLADVKAVPLAKQRLPNRMPLSNSNRRAVIADRIWPHLTFRREPSNQTDRALARKTLLLEEGNSAHLCFPEAGRWRFHDADRCRIVPSDVLVRVEGGRGCGCTKNTHGSGSCDDQSKAHTDCLQRQRQGEDRSCHGEDLQCSQRDQHGDDRVPPASERIGDLLEPRDQPLDVRQEHGADSHAGLLEVLAQEYPLDAELVRVLGIFFGEAIDLLRLRQELTDSSIPLAEQIEQTVGKPHLLGGETLIGDPASTTTA